MAEKRTRTLHDDVGVRQQLRRQRLANMVLVDDLEEEVDAHPNEAHQFIGGAVPPHQLGEYEDEEQLPLYQLDEEQLPLHQLDEYDDDDDWYEINNDDFHSCVDDSDLDGDCENLDDFDEEHQQEIITEEQQSQFQNDLAIWVLSCNVKKTA